MLLAIKLPRRLVEQGVSHRFPGPIDRDAPGTLHLGVGAAGVGLLAYTAYLGGKLVHESGIGVELACGVYRADAPALRQGPTSEFLKTAATELAHGVQHMAEELGQGKFAPTPMTAGQKIAAAAPAAAAPA